MRTKEVAFVSYLWNENENNNQLYLKRISYSLVFISFRRNKTKENIEKQLLFCCKKSSTRLLEQRGPLKGSRANQFTAVKAFI